MINGAHAIVYSKNPEADRGFLKDVLGLPHVDVGGGWLIFGLPPAEIAVHPSEKNDVHELYFTCTDVNVFIAAMAKHGVACGPVENRGWGLLTTVRLPGGGKLGVYQPRHARPRVAVARRKAPARPARGGKATTARPKRPKTRRQTQG